MVHRLVTTQMKKTAPITSAMTSLASMCLGPIASPADVLDAVPGLHASQRSFS